MLGSGGATKIVNDMSSLTDIARAIGDGTKADKLEAIRDEFKGLLKEVQNKEKSAQERINLADVKDSDNKIKWDELVQRQKILDNLETTLSAKEDSLRISSLQIMADQSALKVEKEDFDKVRSDWADLRTKVSQSLIVEREKVEADLDKKEKAVKSREDAVSKREEDISIKETTLFKQSQLAQAFIQSVK